MSRRQIIALALYLTSCASVCVAAVAYPRGAESLAWFALGGFLTLFALAAAVADTEWNRDVRRGSIESNRTTEGA